MEQTDNDQIHAGDTVYHKPSRETWVVLGVQYSTGRLCVAGWPHTIADIADCNLTERGNGITDEYRTARTQMFGTGWDE